MGQKEEIVQLSTAKKVGNGICSGRCCSLKEMLAPNLTGSKILEYIFIYTSDEAYLSPLACTKHAVMFGVEMKPILKK